MAEGSSTERSASTSEGPRDGDALDGAASRPTSAPTVRLRQMSGKAIDVPAAPAAARESFARSLEKNSTPWRMTQLADDQSPGPRFGVRPRSASTFRFPLRSRSEERRVGKECKYR